MCAEAAPSLPCMHEGPRLEQGLPTAFWKLIRCRGAQESKKGDTWRLDMESGLDPSSGPGISRSWSRLCLVLFLPFHCISTSHHLDTVSGFPAPLPWVSLSPTLTPQRTSGYEAGSSQKAPSFLPPAGQVGPEEAVSTGNFSTSRKATGPGAGMTPCSVCQHL